jgi:hypothetical protein
MRREIYAGLIRGLLFFLPWAALRILLLRSLDLEGPKLSEYITDVEFYSLTMNPAFDFYVLAGLALIAMLLAFNASLRPGQVGCARSWAYAATSCLLAGLGLIYYPVLVMSGRFPALSRMGESYESLDYFFTFGLGSAWLAVLGILRWSIRRRSLGELARSQSNDCTQDRHDTRPKSY